MITTQQRWLALLVGFALSSCHGKDDNKEQVGGSATSPHALTSEAPGEPSSAPVLSGSASSAPSEAPVLVYENDELPDPDLVDATLADQRKSMFKRMVTLGVASEPQVAKMEDILSKAKWAGQGNPAVTKHPISRSQCMDQRKKAGVKDEKKQACAAPFMVPLYDPAKETEADSQVCIDRYEFPGLPCDYPVTWITTKQAEEMCQAIDKRLCDAHEWEGGCAGALHTPEDEYAFGKPRTPARHIHNDKRKITWAYGETRDLKKCGTGSGKSKTCNTISWKGCGTNTYPAGSFLDCKSSFGVYDQHGNAAEQMALPLKPEDLGSRGGFGEPELKGSWFNFQQKDAHEDDCRWRAPNWHENEGKNHMNYHLGFRCCKDIKSTR